MTGFGNLPYNQYTGDTSNGQYRSTTASNHSDPTQAPGAAVAYGATLAHAQRISSTARTLETGVRAGEITGYRFWKLRKKRLRSWAMEYYWTPGAIEEVPEDVHEYPLYGPGFHAFNSMAKLEREIADEVPYIRAYGEDVVVGEIEMWGSVMEHQHGYRSQFAAITKLHYIIRGSRGSLTKYFPYRVSLKKLRKIYGVN